MAAGQDDFHKATQANFCSRFKRTINIKEELDGDKYSYSLHAISGKEKSLSHLLKKAIQSTKSESSDVSSSKKNANTSIESSYQKGKLYGSYYASVATPPTRVKLVTPPCDKKSDILKLSPLKPEKIPPNEIVKDMTTANVKPKFETPDKSASPKVLKLNFNYTRSIPKVAEMSDDESDLSSIEDLQLEYVKENAKEASTTNPNLVTTLFGCRQQPEFVKFIPVPFPIPIQMPKLDLHKKYKQEWKDVQKAFEHDQACETETSCSDTQLTAKKSETKSSKKLRRLSRLFPRNLPQSGSSNKKSMLLSQHLTRDKSQSTSQSPTSSLKTSDSSVSRLSTASIEETKSNTNGKTKQLYTKGSQTSSKGGETTALELSRQLRIGPGFKSYKRPQRYPHHMDPRFEETTNEQLLEVNVKKDPNFCATLYIELSEIPNIDLCHIQTEMAVAAMLNFFHPYNDVQCVWVKNITEKLHELLTDKSLRAKFSTLLHLRKFEAILVLSNEAGDLLKHRNMCFLHSLASALHISAHRLLVLARNPWMTRRPTTAPC